MADPFVAEIRIFPFNFPPTGWAFCQGQLMPISQNTALFALVGTFYGGDGKSTFALPDLEGSAAMGQGQGQGLSDRFIGEQSGSTAVTLLQSEIPFHTHSLNANSEDGNRPIPGGTSLARYDQAYQTNTSANLQPLAPEALPVAGGSQPHNNMMQYLTLSFCIALQGVFPQRP
jgi:microcystin-dependent protein